MRPRLWLRAGLLTRYKLRKCAGVRVLNVRERRASVWLCAGVEPPPMPHALAYPRGREQPRFGMTA